MKFIVGIMLTSLGTLWTGEGLGVTWSPWGDTFNIPALIVAYLVTSSLLVTWLRVRPEAATA